MEKGKCPIAKGPDKGLDAEQMEKWMHHETPDKEDSLSLTRAHVVPVASKAAAGVQRRMADAHTLAATATTLLCLKQTTSERD